MEEVKFDSEEDAFDKMTKVFHKHRVSEDEISIVMDASYYISRKKLLKLIQDKLKEGKSNEEILQHITHFLHMV